MDRVVKYDFTHRDVPEAFEGFRIAFISDLHYKSCLLYTSTDDEVYLYAVFGGFVETVDHGGVLKGVHF